MISSISFNEIADEISLKYLPLVDNIYDLLNPDHEKGMRTYARFVEDTVREWYNHYPAVLTKSFENGVTSGTSYTFIDNFDDYIAGTISEDQVELVPESIARISTMWGHKTTSNNYRYIKPRLMFMVGANQITYFAFPPIRWQISPDGKFTEDSKVYFVDINDDDVFKEAVALSILRYLQMTRNSITQPTGLQFFDFRETIEYLQQIVDTYYAVAPTLYRCW